MPLDPTMEAYPNQTKLNLVLGNFRVGSSDEEQLVSLQLLPSLLTSTNLKYVFPKLNFSFLSRLINTPSKPDQINSFQDIGILCLLPFYSDRKLVDSDILLNFAHLIGNKLTSGKVDILKLVFRAWKGATENEMFCKRMVQIDGQGEGLGGSKCTLETVFNLVVELQTKMGKSNPTQLEGKGQSESLNQLVEDGFVIGKKSLIIFQNKPINHHLFQIQAILLNLMGKPQVTTDSLDSLMELYINLVQNLDFQTTFDSAQHLGTINFSKLVEKLFQLLSTDLKLKSQACLLISTFTKQFYFSWLDVKNNVDVQFVQLMVRFICLELRLQLTNLALDTSSKVVNFEVQFLLLVEFLDLVFIWLLDLEDTFDMDTQLSMFTWIKETYQEILAFLSDTNLQLEVNFQLSLTNSLLNYLSQDLSILQSGSQLELEHLFKTVDKYQLSHEDTINKFNINFNLTKLLLQFDTNNTLETALETNLAILLPIIIKVFNKNHKEELIVVVHLLHLLETWFQVELDHTVKKRVDGMYTRFQQQGWI